MISNPFEKQNIKSVTIRFCENPFTLEKYCYSEIEFRKYNTIAKVKIDGNNDFIDLIKKTSETIDKC